jgi:dihydrofolate reductase
MLVSSFRSRLARTAVNPTASPLLAQPTDELASTVTSTGQRNELRQPGKNIVFHGGVRTARNLTQLNLIDEYQLVVPAVALGVGESLFGNLPDRLKLRLLQVRELEVGALFLRYEPTEQA